MRANEVYPKALFVYDFRLYATDAGVRVRNFPYSLWKSRYLEVFDEVEVIGRQGSISDGEVDALPLSSGPGVTFTAVESLSSLQAQLFGRRRIRRLIREKISTADLIIVRLPSELGYLAVEEARRQSRPCVAEVVGCPFDALWHHGAWRARLWAPISWWRMKRAVHVAPWVIYVTEKFLQKRYATRGESIACSNVSIEKVASRPVVTATVALRSKREIRIGMIGYLGTEYKGADTAIRALARARHQNLRLELVGGGDSSRLKTLSRKLGVAEQVQFLGQLPHEDVHNWLETLDLYIQPSRLEGMPRSLLEAMSHGLPALGSSVGGIPEILPEDVLHSPGDDRHLAALIDRAVEDDRWRFEHACRNLETARRYLLSVLNSRRHEFLRRAAASCVG